MIRSQSRFPMREQNDRFCHRKQLKPNGLIDQPMAIDHLGSRAATYALANAS